MRYPKNIVCPHFHFIPGFWDFILSFGFQCVFMGSKQKWTRGETYGVIQDPIGLNDLWVLQLMGNVAVGCDPHSAMDPKSLVVCQQFF